MPQPFDQSAYQVRFEWGVAGLRRLAPADVVVVVDVLRFSSTVTDAVASGRTVALADAEGWSRNGAAVAAAAGDSTVLLGSLRNASAVAKTVLELQTRRQQRTSVAVIAAGEMTDAGDLRFAVEDQLGAGTIIAALSDLGADHTSPEAAAVCESARGLRRAMRHLLTASGSGKELADGVAATARISAAGLVPTETAAAAEVDATDVVPVLSDGAFVAFS
ncbi:2-phosphosulfolactate phosphatase [Microbacterium murale]|uniref:Probable 2-phosphosulfolactate phosphatase n=1 Tax=Microbacterium murale TaxID=1081040 RepID=A0ABU0PAW8_9MICO|nr:2-phosphosulfolactate phosphatase [Microbacterium murale]MDQ0644480.1 2-phosphosulfolactate phosphatase [Microbacterium murale]